MPLPLLITVMIELTILAAITVWSLWRQGHPRCESGPGRTSR
jgi:hypothetical protein